MKALQIRETGSLDVLMIRDVADPAPAEGDALVRIEAAGVNPSDVGIALGRFPHLVLPRILGRDFAGTVVDGPAELVGKTVWGTGGGELGLTRDGAHAELLTLPANALAIRPPHVGVESAAAMGTPFFTAWVALVELAGLAPGEWVIVSGAAGAVGTASVQIANAAGARPIALVRSNDDVTPLEEIGAAAIARSDRDDVASVVKDLTGGSGAHVATNAVGAPLMSSLVDALADDGRMVIFSAAGGRIAELDLFKFYRKRLTFYGLDTAAFGFDRVGKALTQIGALLENGNVRPPTVAARYSLARARDAYERVKGGGAGKVVLTAP